MNAPVSQSEPQADLPSDRAAIGDALLSVFDKIYVINLAFRTDRRAEIEGELARIGLSFDHKSVELFAASRPAEAGEFPSVGVRGCFQSHLGVLEKMLLDGVERALVLEDDMDFASDFETRATQLLTQLGNTSWDILYGQGPDALAGLPGEPSGFRVVPPELGVLRLHFFAISRRAATAAQPYMAAILDRPMNHPDGGAMHVDGAYSWFRAAHPQFVTQAAVPALATQRPSRTDIHQTRWFDQVAGVRESVALLRRLKRRLTR